MQKSELKIYTSFVSPVTLDTYVNQSNLLPIFILRNIGNSELIGKYSGTAVHCKILSPSTELFRQKRDNQITNDEFQKKYALEISEVNLDRLIKDWELLAKCSGANGIVLLGFGSNDGICHRSTLRSLLNNSGLLENRVVEILV